MRITRVYTRVGDDGSTRLGGGQKVSKDAARVEAYGDVDELNSVIGVVRSLRPGAPIERELSLVQNDLFHLGSDLCILEEDKAKFPVPRIESRHVDRLEAAIDGLQESLQPLEEFVLPGGAPAAAHLHVARTVCRRAERRVVALGHLEPIGAEVVRYLNRLSDLLFVMARFENLRSGHGDVLWDKSR